MFCPLFTIAPISHLNHFIVFIAFGLESGRPYLTTFVHQIHAEQFSFALCIIPLSYGRLGRYSGLNHPLILVRTQTGNRMRQICITNRWLIHCRAVSAITTWWATIVLWSSSWCRSSSGCSRNVRFLVSFRNRFERNRISDFLANFSAIIQNGQTQNNENTPAKSNF